MVLIDNASYHTSASTLKLLKEQEVPIFFLGPYSYLIAPIELYWGLFKNADLNLDSIPTSKSKSITIFSNSPKNIFRI